MSRRLVFASIVFASLDASTLVRLAHAEVTPSEAAPSGDSRFGEIGKPSDVANDGTSGETPPVSAGVASTTQGRVTYSGARVDVPITKRWSIVPQVALLYVRPFTDTDRATVNTFVGGGIGWRPADGWSLELSSMYGPTANGLQSIGGAFAIGKEFGADWAHDRGPVVAATASLNATHFRWSDGLGPAGPTLTQMYLTAQATIFATQRFELTPKGMLFAYDHTLTDATGDRLGTVSTLARVGSYAPAWTLGARVGYRIGDWFTPFVDADEIGYAASIGHATKLVGGVKLRLAKHASIVAAGGAIFNRVGGPLVPPEFSLGVVPVAGIEAEWSF